MERALRWQEILNDDHTIPGEFGSDERKLYHKKYFESKQLSFINAGLRELSELGMLDKVRFSYSTRYDPITGTTIMELNIEFASEADAVEYKMKK